jgi:hypothetical protein
MRRRILLVLLVIGTILLILAFVYIGAGVVGRG